MLASAGPSRLSSTQISTHTLRKTARGKCVCSPPWTGWKTTCSSSLKRAYQQHQLQGKILPLRGRRTSSADCGFTATTSTTRWRGRTSWSGPGSWVCPDSACPGSLALCVWKVLSLPARSSGPGSFDCWYFKLLRSQPEACCGVTFTIVHPPPTPPYLAEWRFWLGRRSWFDIERTFRWVRARRAGLLKVSTLCANSPVLKRQCLTHMGAEEITWTSGSSTSFWTRKAAVMSFRCILELKAGNGQTWRHFCTCALKPFL